MKFLSALFGNKQDETNLESIKQALKPVIEPLYQPAIRLEKANTKPADTIASSRFGGKPRVGSSSFVWPRCNAAPLSFLGQIDLAEIATVINYDWLPEKGHLLFFYDTVSMPWGFDPKDRDGWQVIYQDSTDYKIDYPSDLAPETQLHPFPISMAKKLTLPSINSDDLKPLSWSEDQYDAYDALYESLIEEEHFHSHQFGGYPLAIQDDGMALECQLASNGVYVGSPEDYNSAEAQSLAAGAQDWKLLFQIDSDEALGVMWGDAGRLYFWVRAAEARANNFKNCWVVLQCG